MAHTAVRRNPNSQSIRSRQPAVSDATRLKRLQSGDGAMPVGPNREKRPVGVVQNAVRVMEVATGIREEEYVDPSKPRRPKTEPDKVAQSAEQ